jgi:hypothetical protein
MQIGDVAWYCNINLDRLNGGLFDIYDDGKFYILRLAWMDLVNGFYVDKDKQKHNIKPNWIVERDV